LKRHYYITFKCGLCRQQLLPVVVAVAVDWRRLSLTKDNSPHGWEISECALHSQPVGNSRCELGLVTNSQGANKSTRFARCTLRANENKF